MSSLSERLAALNREKGATSAPPAGGFGESSAPSAGRHLADEPAGEGASADQPLADHSSTSETSAGAGAESSPLSPQPSPNGHANGAPKTIPQSSAAARVGATKDRFEDLKESVHSELLQQLGPQLYDANLEV
ncbi:MAG: hypothetical protein JOZ82_13885, partial [Marmoricola sp.]|nr:hypothetical protein [Marmoricola sp.]